MVGIFRRQQRCIKQDRDSVDGDKIHQNSPAPGALHLKNGSEGSRGFPDIETAQNGLLDGESCQLDAFVDIEWLIETMQAAIDAEKKDSGGDMQGAEVEDDHA